MNVVTRRNNRIKEEPPYKPNPILLAAFMTRTRFRLHASTRDDAKENLSMRVLLDISSKYDCISPGHKKA